MDIQLIEPTSILDDEYCAMMAEIAEGPPQEGYILPDLTGSFSEFVERLHRESRGEGLAPGRVRQTTWWALDDQDNLLGEIRLRHELTSALLIQGGNIGYVVRPSARRQGAATQMLKLLLREASQIGLKRVLLTCDADNEASRRTIELNGGVSDPQPIVPEQNWLRYWINQSG